MRCGTGGASLADIGPCYRFWCGFNRPSGDSHLLLRLSVAVAKRLLLGAITRVHLDCPIMLGMMGAVHPKVSEDPTASLLTFTFWIAAPYRSSFLRSAYGEHLKFSIRSILTFQMRND